MKLFMPKRKEKDTLISYDTNSKLWLSMQQTVLEMLFVDDQEKNIKKCHLLDLLPFNICRCVTGLNSYIETQSTQVKLLKR